MDEGILRFFSIPFGSVFEDKVAKEMVASCTNARIPITVNKYLWEPEQLHSQILTVKRDGRFSGFILYETASFLELKPGTGCSITMESVGSLRQLLHAPTPD